MRDERSGAAGGGWPQVEWPGVGDGQQVATEQDAPVEPDGYVYDGYGYAHPVYSGYVYDAEGNWVPVEEFAATVDAFAQGAYDGYQAPGAVVANPEAAFSYDRYAGVDPQQWGFGAGSADELFAAGSRAELKQSRRGARRRRSFIALTVALLAFGATGLWVYNNVLPQFAGPTTPAVVAVEDYPGPGTGTVNIVIEQGDTGIAIADTLFAADVVASRAAFIEAHAANPEAVGIQPGTYAMFLQMKASDAVDRLLDRANRVELRATIPEGFRVTQIVERLAQVTQIPVEDFEAALEDPHALGLPEDVDNIEGWLFPATYVVEPDDTADEILTAMVSKTLAELERLEIDLDDAEDILIKASLIEREISRAEDRPKAARAIANRLDRGMPLQIDATLAYGLNKSGLELTRDDLDGDHPYNTYRHMGLPPSAIGSPGIAAIEAVLNPDDGDWVFWVTVDLCSGETKFAVTNEEHNVNRAELNAWVEENGTEGCAAPDTSEG